MSEKYTPDEVELIGCYAGAMEEQAGEDYATAKADAARGIAKIQADALREWSNLVQMELAATASHGIDLGEKYLHGAHSMLRQASEYADRIEEEA